MAANLPSKPAEVVQEQQEEETMERLLAPPSPLQQLAEWRAKAIARMSGAAKGSIRPRKRKPT